MFAREAFSESLESVVSIVNLATYVSLPAALAAFSFARTLSDGGFSFSFMEKV